MSKKIIFTAFIVSLGGFLFGFDAGVISGVMTYAGPEFNLTDLQTGWVVSSPTFSAMIAMLITGKLSDIVGRKKILLYIAFSYALSAILSAYATSYEMLYIARMIGGLAFGAALIIAPTYIAEIASSKNRGTLVSIQQLNIVLGFFAAFLSNYILNSYLSDSTGFLSEETVWRWMLGIEFIPAVIYFLLLFSVPKSPRWLYLNGKTEKAREILISLHGKVVGVKELENIQKFIIESSASKTSKSLKDLLAPTLRFIVIVGLVIGVLQQITGINAVYFYATSIFNQTGIGTDAAFSSGVLLSFTSVVFTIVAMVLIDKLGRRPLLLVGMAGIAVSLILCAYEFNNATYKLSKEEILAFDEFDNSLLLPYEDVVFTSDLAFKNELKSALGNQVYAKNEGAILEAAIDMNSTIVLIGIIGFIACFAFSLGPVMWVLLSEMFPNSIRGMAIGLIGFVNSFVSWLIQQIFPWELSTFGNAVTFLIYGSIAVVGFFILLKILPETKGKSLEQIELELVKS